jgi:hypothetical protein
VVWFSQVIGRNATEYRRGQLQVPGLEETAGEDLADDLPRPLSINCTGGDSPGEDPVMSGNLPVLELEEPHEACPVEPDECVPGLGEDVLPGGQMRDVCAVPDEGIEVILLYRVPVFSAHPASSGRRYRFSR